jgi:hypothetical protein
MLSRITFELSMVNNDLASGVNVLHSIDIEREAMTAVSPGYWYFSTQPSIGYTAMKHTKHRVLLYPPAVTDPEPGVPVAENEYSAGAISHAWGRLKPLAMGDDSHVIDHLLLPRSRLGNVNGPEYPVWFPRVQIDTSGVPPIPVAQWTEGPAVPMSGAYSVTLTTGWAASKAFCDLGVITNPFVLWDNFGAIQTIRRTQMNKGDFLFVWRTNGDGVMQLLQLPIIGEADPTVFSDMTVVVFDPDHELLDLLNDGSGTMYCTSPAVMNSSRLKLWQMISLSANVHSSMWFHWAEFEALPVDRSLGLPVEFIQPGMTWDQNNPPT